MPVVALDCVSDIFSMHGCTFFFITLKQSDLPCFIGHVDKVASLMQPCLFPTNHVNHAQVVAGKDKEGKKCNYQEKLRQNT